MQQVSEEDYADLRQSYPPQDPAIHEVAYEGLLRRPRSPQTAQLCRFRPAEEADTRIRRWQWWEALSTVKIYVRKYYQFTKWAAKVNAAATGTPGQEVVRASKGTITWIPNDTRINVSNLNRALKTQTTAGFEAWDPHTDMSKHYHRGRTPIQIANVVHRQQGTQSFQ